MSTPPTPDGWLPKIRALLAKAESTEFPEEAEALVAKAHELMARHAIDEATVRRDDAGAERPVEVTELVVPGPYARARAALLGAIARTTYCRLIHRGRVGADHRCVLVGRPGDVEHVRATFAVLEVQASRAMLAASDDTGRPRAFRHAFLLAYAHRIGQRLEEARDAARATVEVEHRDRVALDSISRWAGVDAAVRAEFPRLSHARTSASSGAGFASGQAAADRAALGHRSVGGRRALPEAR